MDITLSSASRFTRNTAQQSAGVTIRVMIVLATMPPVIAKAIGPQYTCREIGIDARLVAAAVRRRGRCGQDELDVHICKARSVAGGLTDAPAAGRRLGTRPCESSIRVRVCGPLSIVRRFWALLHKATEGRMSPFPGQPHPTVSVTGMPRAVKPFMTATRIWNPAT